MNIIGTEYLILFSVALMAIAFLYASVGHGGASGYLALMALFAFPIAIMKPTALLFNIFISGISFWFFIRNHHFKWKLFYPFAMTSIPAAFIGGYININATLYKQILGIFLFIAILRIMGVFGKGTDKLKSPNLSLALAIGFGIGFFSGMIGIGGGIILSPVIILLAWGNMKQAAAVSALFIFVNSISGIIGFMMNGGVVPSESFLFIPAALIGGAFGAFYGSKKFTYAMLKYVLSVVLTIAGIKLMII